MNYLITHCRISYRCQKTSSIDSAVLTEHGLTDRHIDRYEAMAYTILAECHKSKPPTYYKHSLNTDVNYRNMSIVNDCIAL